MASYKGKQLFHLKSIDLVSVVHVVFWVQNSFLKQFEINSSVTESIDNHNWNAAPGFYKNRIFAPDSKMRMLRMKQSSCKWNLLCISDK